MGTVTSLPEDLPAPFEAGDKIPTNIKGLDEILNGGFPAGAMTLLVGGPGSGKTMMGLEFLVRGVCSRSADCQVLDQLGHLAGVGDDWISVAS